MFVYLKQFSKLRTPVMCRLSSVRLGYDFLCLACALLLCNAIGVIPRVQFSRVLVRFIVLDIVAEQRFNFGGDRIGPLQIHGRRTL